MQLQPNAARAQVVVEPAQPMKNGTGIGLKAKAHYKSGRLYDKTWDWARLYLSNVDSPLVES